MIKDIQREEYFFVGRTFFTLFDADIEVAIDLKSDDFSYAEKCVSALNNMSEEVIDKLCEYSVLYCEDFCDAIGEKAPEITSNRDILNYIQPLSLIVNLPEDESIVIHLELNCEWEDEHGLEWLVKDDKVLHVGAYGNEPEYADASYYHNSWNYANLKRN